LSGGLGLYYTDDLNNWIQIDKFSSQIVEGTIIFEDKLLIYSDSKIWESQDGLTWSKSKIQFIGSQNLIHNNTFYNSEYGFIRKLIKIF